MKCVRCDDTGLIEYVAGSFPASYWMKGQLVTVEVVASERHPVYRRCPCLDARPKPERSSATYG